jgi:transposase
LEDSRIDLQFLPPYAPDLNIIERLWKFFKRQVIYNRNPETPANYQAARNQFFAHFHQHTEQLRSLMTEILGVVCAQ